jgi:hypothetical protein
MFDRRKLTKRLIADLNVRPVSALHFELVSVHDWFRAHIRFRLVGVYRWKIEGWVNISHIDADRFGWNCLNEFGGDFWKWALSQDHFPCGVGFPVARLAPWDANHCLSIRELSADESADRISADIKQFVLPYIEALDTPEKYIEVLLEDAEPAKWLYSQPLNRFAQIAYLAHYSGIRRESYLAKIASQKNRMAGQLRDVDLDTYIQKVIHAAEHGG